MLASSADWSSRRRSSVSPAGSRSSEDGWNCPPRSLPSDDRPRSRADGSGESARGLEPPPSVDARPLSCRGWPDGPAGRSPVCSSRAPWRSCSAAPPLVSRLSERGGSGRWAGWMRSPRPRRRGPGRSSASTGPVSTCPVRPVRSPSPAGGSSPSSTAVEPPAGSGTWIPTWRTTSATRCCAGPGRLPVAASPPEAARATAAPPSPIFTAVRPATRRRRRVQPTDRDPTCLTGLRCACSVATAVMAARWRSRTPRAGEAGTAARNAPIRAPSSSPSVDGAVSMSWRSSSMSCQ